MESSNARNLTRAEIHSTVVSALLSATAEQNLAPDRVHDGTSIGRDGLGLSSLNVLQALVSIEDRLDIVLDDRAVARTRLETVGTVVDLVERLARAGS